MNFILYFNAHDDEVEFTVPNDEYSQWETVVDTAGRYTNSEPVEAGKSIS